MSIKFESSIQMLPNANIVPDGMPKPQKLCTRLVYGTVNCVKRFGLGVAAAGIVSPVSWGGSYLAGKVGLIQEIGDGDVIMNATCKLVELVKQIDSNVPWPHAKPIQAGMIGFYIPILEEILFRGLIQDVLLTKIPRFVLKKVSPGKETALDTRSAKAARITLTAALFSAFHLTNSDLFADSYVSRQLVVAFVSGIGLGILKESNAGLLGAMGGHISHNMIVIAPALWSC